MSRFEWKLLAKWNLPSLLGERRERRDSARSTFRPRVDALEGRALLSHIAIAAIKHPVAKPTIITSQTGGNGSNGSGGGGGVSINVAGAGLFTPVNGKNLLNGAVLDSPLPVEHVFNSKGKVIGVRPILPLVAIGQQTGGNGSINVTTGAGSGGAGGVSVLFAPEMGALPKFGYIHGKLYKIYPPLNNTTAISLVSQTGGNGVGGGGGGGGVSLVIPFQVTLQTVRVKNVMAVPIVVETPPAAGTSAVGTVITTQTGGNGSGGGGGGGAFSIVL